MTGEPHPDIWGKIFDGLKDNSEATLACAMVFAAVAIAAWGVSLWFASGLPVAIYVLYFLRMTMRERHLQWMAKRELDMVDQTRGKQVREKAQRSLTHRRTKNVDRP
jgi:hypothetical protein